MSHTDGDRPSWPSALGGTCVLQKAASAGARKAALEKVRVVYLFIFGALNRRGIAEGDNL